MKKAAPKLPEKPTAGLPAFRIPLDDTNYALIGKILTIWPHIDSCLDAMIQFLEGLDAEQYERVYGSDTTGRKIINLRGASSRVISDTTKEAVLKLCQELNMPATDRNHIAHGVWGVHNGSPGAGLWMAPLVVARNSKRKNKQYLRFDELPRIWNELVPLSWEVERVVCLVTGKPPTSSVGMGTHFSTTIIPKEKEYLTRKPLNDPQNPEKPQKG